MSYSPLAERLRPDVLSAIVGQSHLIGHDGFIDKIVKGGRPLSILLWGPPGSGKTSIARLYAKAFDVKFHSISAIFSGVSEIKQIVKEIENNPIFGSQVLLFVDEIHRFNKAQQDAFLPFLEKGTIILVGATAENPSFYLNNALLSRLRVLKVNALDENSLDQLISRYEQKIGSLSLDKDARQYLILQAQGDGRYLYNLIENIEAIRGQDPITLEAIKKAIQKRSALYDKNDEQHYNLISALHKSVRGSDPDAAMYWFARMLEGGEEPLFIARRLIRMASEDIGLADPQALPLAIAACQSYQMLGSPEGELALAQVVIYLSLAPKSNAVEIAYNEAREVAKRSSHCNPPSIILNPTTKLLKEVGYGKGYVYDHDLPDGFSGQQYFPQSLRRHCFYRPVERGYEREMSKRCKYFTKLRSQKSE